MLVDQFLHDTSHRLLVDMTINMDNRALARICLNIRVAARQLTSKDVLTVLNEAIEKEGPPSYIRSDNDSEFIAHQVQQGLSDKSIKTIYIDPGSPWLPSEAIPQGAIARITNGFIESFHNLLRDECLKLEVLLSMAEAKVLTERCPFYHM